MRSTRPARRFGCSRSASRRASRVHADAGAYLQGALRERELELLADPEVQQPQLRAVRVPEGRDAREVQRRLLLEHGIEIGGSLVVTPA
jgi:aspartate aminotransferase-like enzyme